MNWKVGIYMKLGISTFAFPWSIGVGTLKPVEPMNIFKFLEKVSDLNLNLVQICDNLPLHELDEKTREKVKKHANHLNISIEVGTRGLKKEKILRYIEIANQLNSPILRIVIDEGRYAPRLKKIKNIINSVIKYLEQNNIILAIENHDRFKSDKLIEIITATGNHPNVGICLDTVNSFGALEDPLTVLNKLAPYTVNLHIKDIKIDRVETNMGFVVEGTPAGKGMLEIPYMINKLKNNNKKEINALLELWVPSEKDIETTINKEQKWIEESIKYLKSQI